MQPQYIKIIEQFRVRAEVFDDSACWIKDGGLLDIHKNLISLSSNRLILDACCGTGLVGNRIRDNGRRVVGVDLSIDMLERARQRLNFCINATVEFLPFKDGIFDAVVCRQAFHFLDIDKVIKEFYRVTSFKGSIVISQIVAFGKEDADWLYQIHKKIQPALRNFLSEDDLKNTLLKAGYKDIRIEEYLVEESINRWVTLHGISPSIQAEIKRMFLSAPKEYKLLHSTRILKEDIFDTMRWVILAGKKL